MGVTASPALAAPDLPDDPQQAEQKLHELSRRAEELTEKHKKAQDDHEAKQEELAKATARAEQADRVAEQARNEEERFRGRVDQLTSASYQGARLNKMSALLASENPDDFLDRAATLDVLAKDNNKVIGRLAAATHRAERAEHRAQAARDRAAKAEAAAARLKTDIENRKSAMDQQVAKVEEHYNSLSQQVQEEISGETSSVGQLLGGGSAIEAVNAALGKQGSPYVYGAKGPSQFDCSGLVQWSFQQAGVDLPSSTQSQITEGKEVSQSEMKPGDVIFFYSSGSHNGIYIGNGQIVHAPTEGQTVTVEEVAYMGEVNSVRRYT
ncbi:C40 family peptidase [Salinifilum aidingensis]